MHRSGNDFTYIHNLVRGKHAFKFIVDDTWRYSPTLPQISDVSGRINNFVDVTDFKPFHGDVDFAERIDGGNLTMVDSGDNTDTYGQTMPDLDSYAKDPPPLPPHLRHIILNKPPPVPTMPPGMGGGGGEG